MKLISHVYKINFLHEPDESSSHNYGSAPVLNLQFKKFSTNISKTNTILAQFLLFVYSNYVTNAIYALDNCLLHTIEQLIKQNPNNYFKANTKHGLDGSQSQIIYK
jgi:hypothetical protein